MAKSKVPISVIERRLKSGSIFGTSSKPIPLVDPTRWTVRVVNSRISESHLYDMQAEKGWVYAEVSDLAMAPEEMGFHVLDGRVVRGEHGHEVIMKMERKDYQAVQQEKDRMNRVQTFGRKATKQAVIGALQAAEGEQAADFMAKAINQIQVTDTRVAADD